MSIKAANNVFPHDPDDNWKQKLDRGGYEGTAKDLDDKINAIKNPDGILIAGSISKLGNVISIGEMTFKCRIDNKVLTNIEDFSTTIINATENYKRIDILVFTKFSTIVKIQGDEELESAKEPDVPPGTIKLSFISVFGSQINDPSQPILIPDISEKLDKGGFVGTAQDIVDSIPDPVDISVKLDKGGYNGTAADLLTKNTDQDVLGIKIFFAGKLGLRNIANTFTSFFSNSNTASRTYTLQNRSGTLLDNTDLANINSSLSTKQSVFSGVANYLTKSLNSSSLIVSRLFDNGMFFGIGTIFTPTKDITLGYQDDREIGVEDSDSISRGKDLTISAGRTVNYQLDPNFTFYQSVPSESGISGACTDFNGNNYFQAFGGSALMYKRDYNGSAFYHVGGAVYSYGIMVAPNNDRYQVGQGIAGDIYKNGVAIGQKISNANINLNQIACNLNGDVYISADGNLWYKPVASTLFTMIDNGGYSSIAVNISTGDMYGVKSRGLFKQTAGSGSFVNTGVAVPGRGLTITPDGNMFVFVDGGDIYRKISSGTFIAMNQISRSWRAITYTLDGDVFAATIEGNIYKLGTSLPGTPNQNGGTLKLRSGTGKGSGNSKIQLYTGQKTISGTDMQLERLRLEVDELGNIIVKTPKVYVDNSSAIAAGLETGTLYWTSSGDMKIVV